MLLIPLLVVTLAFLGDGSMMAAERPAPQAAADGAVAPPQVARPSNGNHEPDVAWNLTLPEAIRLGLENSEVVRVVDSEIRTVRIGAQEIPIGEFEPDLAGPVVTPGKAASFRDDGPLGDVPPASIGPHGVGVKIARLNADASVWNFKEAVEAHVRSIEQTYWALAALQVNLWGRETAVRLGEEILRAEEAEALTDARGMSNVKEAREQLENFKLNLVTATSDLVDAERRLRTILGLPTVDNRRIIASTAPAAATNEIDRATSLKQMLASRPEILQQRGLVADASLLEAVAATPEEQAAARDRLARQQDHLGKLVRKAVQDLDWSSMTIDAEQKQVHAAQRLRDAAQKRLEVQRAFYEQGRITVDRMLDAVTQYANAISQEATAKCSYNTAIASFEEVRGTLLVADGIALRAGPAPRKPDLPAAPAPAGR